MTAAHPLTFTVASNGDITVAEGANAVTTVGAAMEIIVGGAGSDTFKVTPPAIAPAVPLTIDGQGGVSDVMNFNGDPAIFTNTGTSITTIAGAPPAVYINHSNLEVVNIVLGPFGLLPPAPDAPEASPTSSNESSLPMDPARTDPEPLALVPRWWLSAGVSFTMTRPRIPPLLGGEGRGEGETDVPSTKCVPTVTGARWFYHGQGSNSMQGMSRFLDGEDLI